MFFFFNDENNNSFEEIKHIDENDQEYWLARELQEVLGYAKWQNFEKIIDKAKESCRNSGFPTLECFTNVSKTSAMPNGGFKYVGDIMLNRYACYLIAQNGDPKKEAIALAQTYFAVQTRRQELQDQFDQLTEDQRRLAIRGELTEHNKSLVEAAQQAGVETRGDFAKFQNRGYQGLYGGLGAKEIHSRKGLKKAVRCRKISQLRIRVSSSFARKKRNDLHQPNKFLWIYHLRKNDKLSFVARGLFIIKRK